MSAQLNSLLQSARMKERSEVKKNTWERIFLPHTEQKQNQAKHEYEELLFL